jgi:hypothetical protein
VDVGPLVVPDAEPAKRIEPCKRALDHGLSTRHILPLLAMRGTRHGSGLGQWRWVKAYPGASTLGLSARLPHSLSLANFHGVDPMRWSAVAGFLPL